MVSALFSALSVFLSRLEQQLEGEGPASSGSLSASAAAEGTSRKGCSLSQGHKEFDALDLWHNHRPHVR
jgi:hypothetical protein